MKKSTLWAISSVLLLSFPVWADVTLPQSFNFDGILTDTSGTAITTSTTVDFKIYDPSGQCLLFEETQTVTPDSSGNFSVLVGSGTRVSASDPGLTWPVIFQNNGTVRSSGSGCSPGYTPAAGDGRDLRVSINGSALTPDFTMASVPMATVAQTLQGMDTTAFVQVNTSNGVTQSNVQTVFSNFSQLMTLLTGASTEYARSASLLQSSNQGMQLPVVTAPSAPPAGEVWYSPSTLTMNYYNGTTTMTALATAGFGAAGQVLTSTGTSTPPTWQTLGAGSSLPLAGGTMTGPIILGGNTIYGNSTASGTLTLDSTSNGSKGPIILGPSGGNVGIGTSAPAVSLDMKMKTDAIALPTGTTTLRPTTPANGMIRYNVTTNGFEGYANGMWTNLSFMFNARYGFGTTAPNSLFEVTSGGLNQNPSLVYGSTFAADAVPFSDAQTSSGGTSTGTAFVSLSASSVGAMNTSVTTTNADTVIITGAPIAGTNETLTNTSALYIAGNNVLSSGVATNAYGLNVNAPTGAANNYAAVFSGGNVGVGTSAPVATLDVHGHIANSGSAATVSSCGTSPTINGNDTRGTVTFPSGSVSTCTVNFAISYSAVPVCVATWNGSIPGASPGIAVTPAVGSLLVTFSGAVSAGGTFSYYCMQ